VGARLRPIREDEFGDWRRRTLAWYETDLVAHGGMDEAAARRKAAADASAYPATISAPDHAVFVLEDEAGEPVGSLWFQERTKDGRRLAWVYAVEIDEAYRGRGHGRAAMELLEDEARRRGIDRIELNVFGGNEVARGLYRSLGYDELSVSMGKHLA
jgi:ribosomal protein S18 acetylase RimI-like enzyme